MRAVLIILIVLVLIAGLGVTVALFQGAQAAELEVLRAQEAHAVAAQRRALAERGLHADDDLTVDLPRGSLEEQNEALRSQVESLRSEAAALLAEIEAAGGQLDETLEERLRRLALQQSGDDGGR